MERQERKDFNDTHYTIDICVIKIFLDISLCAGQVLNKERLCLSEYDEYMQDISPGPDMGQGKDQHRRSCTSRQWAGRRITTVVFGRVALVLP